MPSARASRGSGPSLDLQIKLTEPENTTRFLARNQTAIVLPDTRCLKFFLENENDGRMPRTRRGGVALSGHTCGNSPQYPRRPAAAAGVGRAQRALGPPS